MDSPMMIVLRAFLDYDLGKLDAGAARARLIHFADQAGEIADRHGVAAKIPMSALAFVATIDRLEAGDREGAAEDLVAVSELAFPDEDEE